MAIEVDVVISGTTATAVYDKATTAIITTNLLEDKLATKGGIITGPITPSETDAIDLGSATKRFNSIYVKDAHLAGSSLHLGDAATISAGAGGGFSFDTDAETVFGDIKVRNLTVTGVQSVIESTNLVIKDNIIVVNSGEAGAGITLTSGGLVIDRGTLENATILFNDTTDKFEFNFPISVDGSELALVPNLIATGQTLQGQITSNDGDIVTLTTNLESTGSTVAANLITSGQTLTTNLASTGTTVAANLVTSGQTLTTNLASTGATVAANLVTSGQYLTSEVGTLSGLSVFHSMTGNFATHFINLDDIYLAGNQGKYLKVNSAGDGLSYDLPPVTGVGGEGGGATHFTGLVDTPNGYSGIGALPEDGGLVVFNSTSEQIAYASSGAFASDADLISSGNTLDSKRDVLSGNLISSGNALDAARDTLSGNLISTGNNLENQIISNDGDIVTLTSNLVSTGNTLDSQRDTLSGNLISTGNNLEAQIISNDGDISTLQTATGTLQDQKFEKTGGTLSGSVTPNASGTLNLGTRSLPFQSGYFDELWVGGNTLQIGDEASISADASGFSFATTGTTTFGDVSITGDLGVSGNFTLGDTTTDKITTRGDLYVEDDAFFGDAVKVTGILTVDGTASAATPTLDTHLTTKLYVDTTGDAITTNLASTGANLQAQVTTDIANLVSTGAIVDGVSGNLISSGQTLQTQITSNDSDITSLTSNLVTTGQTLTTTTDTISSNLITSGQTLQTQITSNDSNISSLTTNLVSTGSTLAADIVTVSGLTFGNDSDIATITANLVSTGQTLTTEINTVSGLITSNDGDITALQVATGTLKVSVDSNTANITSNDSDIATLTSNLISTGTIVDDVSGNLIASGQTLTNLVSAQDVSVISGNLITTGQTLQTQITSNDSDISSLTSNLVTTGQTLQTQITSNDSDIVALTSNLITTGQTLTTDVATVSGLITSNDTELSDLRTATGSLLNQVTSNDGDISALTANLISTGSIVDDVSGNLITTGQTLQTQITSNDGDITSLTSNLVTTGQTLQTQITSNDSDVSTLTTNLISTGQSVTSEIAIVSGLTTSNDTDIANLTTNLVTTGQTLQTQVTSNDSDISTLTSNLATTDSNLITTGQTLQTQITSNDSDISTLDSTTVKLTSNQTIAGNKIFSDTVTITDLNVTGTQTTISATNLAIKDNLIEINSGEAGAGITLISGGITINRGSADNANILFDDSTDQFELNFPIATEGNLVATAPNLISTGQTLQTQITSNDGDISTLTSNIATTGQTLQTQITSNDSDISTLTSNLSTTDSNLITTGQTLQTQITSNDSDISTLTTNLISTGTVADDISGNLITTGQTLQTQITSNDGDITSLTTNLASTGSSLDTKIDTLSGVVTLDSETGNLVDTSMTGNFAVNFLDLDDTPSSIGAVAQSVVVNAAGNALVFSGVTAGEGSSTFLGLSDTPVGFTADRLLAVNSAGNAVEFLQSGSLVTDSETGVFATAANLISTGNNLEGQITSNDSDISTLTTNLITTGQTLQTQITSNDSDVSTLTSNLISTGQTLTTDIGTVSGLITSNDTELGSLRTATGSLQTQVTSNDSDITSLTTNLVTTGQTLQTQITSNDSDISSLTTNLISTGQSITSEIAIVSGLTTSNDTDIATLTTNIGTTGQTLQTQITSNDGDISSLTSNLVTTGQTLQTQITSNDSDISTLTTNLISTGSTLDTKIDTLSGVVALDSETGHLADTTVLESFSQGLNVGTSSNLASRKLHVVGDIEISGTIYQSGSIFEGGGGGGGSSTFLGLSDTPGSFTADKYLSVNSAGNAVEFVTAAPGGGVAFDQLYTGDGVTTNYLLTDDVPSARDVLVSVGGLIQTPIIDYTLAGTTGVSFTTGVTSGDEISLRHIAGLTGPSGVAGSIGADGADASGWATTDQGYFTGLDLTGSSVGIVQNASGSVVGLDLADNKWDVSIIEETDGQGVVNDSAWDDVKLLLNFNGSNAATSTTDASDSGHTVAFNGTAQISTAQSKFGGSSVLFDGNSDYLTIADHADWDLGSDDFTIEYWVRFTATGGTQTMFSIHGATSTSRVLYAFATSSAISVYYYPQGLADTYIYNSQSWTHSADTWYHMAFVRNGNDFKMFIDGTQVGSTFNIGSNAFNNAGYPLVLGALTSSGGSLMYYSSCYIDDFRWTKGTARYTSNFTVPSSEFTSNSVIVEAKYIGQIGGWDDTDVDYGIKKISNSELSVKKMGGDDLDRPIDRLYVNVQKLGAVGQGIAFEQLYTGDGSTTAFALPSSVSNARDLMVSVEGLVQIPTVDYSVSTTTLTFTTGVTSGNLIDTRYLALGPSGTAGSDGAAGANGTGVGVSFSNIFTGDGLTSGFAVESSVPEAKDLLVTLNGIIQRPTADYTLVGNTGVYFDSALTSGFNLEARYLSMGGTGAPGPAGAAGGGSFAKDVFTGNGVVSGFTMGRSVSNILETTVFVNGLAQFPDDNYFTNGTSLTFASGDIASGDLIMVRHMY